MTPRVRTAPFLKHTTHVRNASTYFHNVGSSKYPAPAIIAPTIPPSAPPTDPKHAHIFSSGTTSRFPNLLWLGKQLPLRRQDIYKTRTRKSAEREEKIWPLTMSILTISVVGVIGLQQRSVADVFTLHRYVGHMCGVLWALRGRAAAR